MEIAISFLSIVLYYEGRIMSLVVLFRGARLLDDVTLKSLLAVRWVFIEYGLNKVLWHLFDKSRMLNCVFCAIFQRRSFNFSILPISLFCEKKHFLNITTH